MKTASHRSVLKIHVFYKSETSVTNGNCDVCVWIFWIKDALTLQKHHFEILFEASFFFGGSSLVWGVSDALSGTLRNKQMVFVFRVTSCISQIWQYCLSELWTCTIYCSYQVFCLVGFFWAHHGAGKLLHVTSLFGNPAGITRTSVTLGFFEGSCT